MAMDKYQLSEILQSLKLWGSFIGGYRLLRTGEARKPCSQNCLLKNLGYPD